jgi:hypothetical protein
MNYLRSQIWHGSLAKYVNSCVGFAMCRTSLIGSQTSQSDELPRLLPSDFHLSFLSLKVTHGRGRSAIPNFSPFHNENTTVQRIRRIGESTYRKVIYLQPQTKHLALVRGRQTIFVRNGKVVWARGFAAEVWSGPAPDKKSPTRIAMFPLERLTHLIPLGSG